LYFEPFFAMLACQQTDLQALTTNLSAGMKYFISGMWQLTEICNPPSPGLRRAKSAICYL
jgi:hypothetical protein